MGSKINKGVPAWLAQRPAAPSPVMPGRVHHGVQGPLHTSTGATVAIPRRVALAAVGLGIAGALFMGIVVGAASQQSASTGRTGTVAYTAQSGAQSDQSGPVRAPNRVELSAYSEALLTAPGACGLEWHGTDGGWWEPVCQGPHNK